MARKLSAQQEQAAALVAQGVSGQEIAQQVNTSPQTVSRWKARSDFQASVNQLLHQARQSVEYELQGAAALAVNVLKDALSGKPGYSGGDRIRAAGMILDALKLGDIRPGPKTPEGVEQRDAYEYLDEITGGR